MLLSIHKIFLIQFIFLLAYGFSKSNDASIVYNNSDALNLRYANRDSLANYIYIDLEVDSGNNYILNEHYSILFQKRKVLSEQADIMGAFDTGLFDWDSQWTDPSRMRYLFEFSASYFPVKNNKSTNIIFNYGPGENSYYNKRVFKRIISGFLFNKKIGEFENSFTLNLKPTFTEESNIKQFKLNSKYINKKYNFYSGISWDYSTANTENIFDRDVDMDEKLSFYANITLNQSLTSLLFAYDNKGDQAYYIQYRLMKDFKYPTMICFQANFISDTFFDTTLKNYYSDYNAVSPVGEFIGNGESFISTEMILYFTPTVSILSGLHYRVIREKKKVTTCRVQLIKTINNIQNGFEIIYADPATYGQGYQWEIKYISKFYI